MRERFLLHGAGTEARAAARYLQSRGGAVLRLVDDEGGSIEGVEPIGSDEALSFLPGAVYLRSPGVPPHNALATAAAGRAKSATTPTGYWLRHHAPSGTVTVTGTKGKSTTSAILAQLLREAGLSAAAYGNIGRPPLSDRLPEDDHPVLEASSYMMHDLPEADHFHLVTNLYKDHVNWHGSVEAYHGAKLRPFLRRRPSPGAAPQAVIDLYALPGSVQPIEEAAPDDGHRLSIGGETVDTGGREQGFSAGPLRHSLRAAMAAAQPFAEAPVIARSAGAVAHSFEGLPSRQRILPSSDGRIWVDDALATIPEATIAVLRRFEGRRIVLLLGGGDRGQEFGPLQDYVRSCPDVEVIGFDPAGARFAVKTALAGSFVEAIDLADARCPVGGVVLFSPSAPSHAPYRSFEERSALFTGRAAGAAQPR